MLNQAIFSGIFLAALNCLTGKAVAQIEPYLSSPSDTSICISWRTASDTGSLVEYGLSSDQLIRTTTGKCDSLAGNYWWHTARLSGLTPDTRYYYRTVTGNQVSGIRRFRTQPSQGNFSGHYRFAIIGDHQVISDKRYELLVQACKDKVIEKYATSPSDTLIEDHLRLLVCDGDQVNAGILEHYEKMHFGQSRPLMSNIPIMTVVGNHEYSQDPLLNLYRAHYTYDNVSYKGITGKRGEEYYAFQTADILFVMINSNLGNDPDQLDWIGKIVSAADQDPSVKWIIAVNHFCFLSEQMPGDGSVAVRNSYGPLLSESSKYVMHITGHSHLYSRGSLRDHPCHVIINGGASGDQYWGQTAYTDYEDVQKTIEREIFQIVDIDCAKREMTVETYSNGTKLPPGFTEDLMIDKFWMKPEAPLPAKPALAHDAPESVRLPYTFQCGEYSGQEPFNSVEFQIASNEMDFTDPQYDVKRDYENIFLSTGSPDYTPIDQNKGKDVKQFTLDSALLFSGTNYLRFRYRDQSLHWSPWSDTVSFTVLNGKPVQPVYPVLRYKLNGNGNEAMGSGLDGVPDAGVAFASDPEKGNAARFGNKGMIVISSGSTANLKLPDKSISVSCWVKLNSSDYWGGFVGIFQDNGNYEKGWVLGTLDGSFSFALTTNGKMNYLKAAAPLNLGEWYHVAGTFDGITQKIYINGELKGTANIPGDIEYPPFGWFQIGAYKDDNEDFRHDGYIRDVIIYEGSLSIKGVRDLYHNTLSPIVNFEASKTEIGPGRTVQYQDLTQFDPQNWEWHFEGGSPETSHEQNPVVTYSKEGIYNVFLKAGNAYGLDTLLKRDYITVGLTAASQINRNIAARIYPNPAKDRIHIMSDDPLFGNSGLMIYNPEGKLCYSSYLRRDTQSITVDLKHFQRGNYFIRLIHKGQSQYLGSFIIE